MPRRGEQPSMLNGRRLRGSAGDPRRRQHLDDGPPPTVEQGAPSIQSPGRPDRDTTPTPPDATPASRRPDLTLGEDTVDVATWAGSMPPGVGDRPGTNRPEPMVQPPVAAADRLRDVDRRNRSRQRTGPRILRLPPMHLRLHDDPARERILHGREVVADCAGPAAAGVGPGSPQRAQRACRVRWPRARASPDPDRAGRRSKAQRAREPGRGHAARPARAGLSHLRNQRLGRLSR